MKKIPTYFRRDPEDQRKVLPQVTPGCDWVLAGEGVATRKYDGTACLIRDGKLYKRRMVRREALENGRAAAEKFEQVDYDPATEKAFGWVPVGEGKEDKYHREAFEALKTSNLPRPEIEDGTYELVGPKIQGNPEKVTSHVLMAHAKAQRFADWPRDFEGLREVMKDFPHEGIVWHHPDGRMVKIKRKDFQYD